MHNIILIVVIMTLLVIGCVIENWYDKERGLQNTVDGVGLTWLMAALLSFIIAFAVIGAYVNQAPAHDLEHPQLDSWYQGLQNRAGRLCCDGPGKDAVHLADVDWKTQDKPTSHYAVYLNGEWIDVPDAAVVETPNRDGRALVWPLRGYMGLTIACFMPGSLT